VPSLLLSHADVLRRFGLTKPGGGLNQVRAIPAGQTVPALASFSPYLDAIWGLPVDARRLQILDGPGESAASG